MYIPPAVKPKKPQNMIEMRCECHSNCDLRGVDPITQLHSLYLYETRE